jgi:hypothetical protein
MDASETNQRGKAAVSGSMVEKDGGDRDDEDSGSSPMGTCPDQEVASEATARTSGEIPSGWTCVKLEPDC